MADAQDEDDKLRSVALQNAQSILAARRRAEEELLRTKEALERRTEELREETRALELLNETGRALTSTHALEQLLQMVTDAGTRLCGAELGAFFYNTVTEEGDAFRLSTLTGAPRAAFEKFGMPRASPIFAPTFRGEGPVRSDDITQDPRYGQWAPQHGMPPGHLPVRSYLAVPVISGSGTTLGGLFFGHSRPGMFHERSERLLVSVAAFAAVAIDNARLYADLERAAVERERLLAAERAMRLELERAGIMKDEFLATLSHELRTPLNAVVGWSHMLLARTTEGDAFRKGIEAIVRNSRAQAQLVDDLLDMNRIVFGKIKLEVQVVDLDEIVRAAIEGLKPSLAAKQIELRHVRATEVPPVLGDPARLQQVVWNLLSNAVKFTPSGGTVTVAVDAEGAEVRVSVSDTGIGIAKEFLPHVFERFRQADSSSTRKFGGLGLGLSIVKQLVELHGGSVRAESAGEGQGATFKVCIRAAGAGATPDSIEPPSTHGALVGLAVLVVDDDDDGRDLLQTLLRAAGARVSTAASATEGVSAVMRERPDVIVSDIAMPDKDGCQMLRDLRALPAEHGGLTPAIAVTAFARGEDRSRATDAGFSSYIIKPVDGADLVMTVAATVGRAVPPPSRG
jgi:signal transduction histidine kinase/ActR/RegA family two-component response regulator